MAIKTIGTAGDFPIIGDWADFIKGLGTLTEDEVGLLIDNKVYARESPTDLDFDLVVIGAFTITLAVDDGVTYSGTGSGTDVRHDGDFGNGARSEGDFAGQVYSPKNLIIEDGSFHNTGVTTGKRAFRFCNDCTFKRVIAKADSVLSNAHCFDGDGSASFEACRGVGGINVFNLTSGAGDTYACTATGGAGSGFSYGTMTGEFRDNVAYNNTGNDFGGVFNIPTGASNNAGTGTIPGPDGTVILTEDPFEADGYTPRTDSLAQLVGAGIDLSIVTDAAHNAFAVPPSIGAYEATGAPGPTVPVLSNPTLPVYTP